MRKTRQIPAVTASSGTSFVTKEQTPGESFADQGTLMHPLQYSICMLYRSRLLLAGACRAAPGRKPHGAFLLPKSGSWLPFKAALSTGQWASRT